MGSKGRPPKLIIEDLPRKFVREVKFRDGCSQKWHYDLDKNPNGPLMVEMFYPENFFEEEKKPKKSKQNAKKVSKPRRSRK